MATAVTATASVTPSSLSFGPTGSVSSRDLLVTMPELHLGSLQELQLNDFATQQHARQPSQSQSARFAVTTPDVPGSPSPYAMTALAADGGGQSTPASASASAVSSQAKYGGLPPGAAPPALQTGEFEPVPAPAPDRRVSGSDALLPTPPSSQQPGQGPRHPGAAQAAAQSALPGAPRPRAAYAPAPTYPSIVTPLSLQGLIASESPPAVAVAAVARKKPEEEVCIECMMRDRDMADVDVTSPGVWARASDAEYDDLLRRELDDEAMTASSSSHASRPRPRARGTAKLTEDNVRKWITMHPKDNEARWRTITKYVKAQSVLLEQEFAARARNEAETRSLDAKARDRYAQLQRSSGGEQSFVEPATGVRGVRVPSVSNPQTPVLQQAQQSQSYFAPQPETHDPETASIPASPGRILGRKEKEQQDRERDVVLLENGLMLERVDLRRERSAGRARSVSLDKRTGVDDRLSVYSTPMLRTGSGSGPVPSEGVPGGRRAMPRAQSQMSGDRRSLFSGLRSSLAGSMVSLAASRASVVNLHGQNLDREPMPGRAISPSMPTLNDLQQAEWPGIENLPAPPGVAASIGSDSGGKKKKRGALGKLLKFFGSSGASSSKGRASTDSTAQPSSHTAVPSAVDDLSAPLAPPPSLAYLVSRKSGELPAGNQQQQQHQRQQSSTSLAGTATGPSPPTAPSSILPSPTSNRFSWRASNASLDAVMPQNVNGHYVDFPAKHLDTLPESFDMRQQRGRRDTTASSNATRPHTVFLTDKSLPPLPPEAYALALAQQQQHPPRPATAPGIRDHERERRQSFAGIPTHPVGSHPHTRGATTEFGEEDAGKRKSRFGLGFLGGKRKSSHQLRSASTSRALNAVVQDPQFVAYRYLGGGDDHHAALPRQ